MTRAIAYVIRSRARWRQRDFDDAIADANEALKIEPSLAAAWPAARAHGSKEDGDQAIADATKALEINPNVAAAYVYRGIARGRKDDLDGAIADTVRAVETDPDNALALISLGVLHAKKCEPGLAYADFGKATETEPIGGFDGYRVRGIAYEHRSDYRHAIADFSHWIEIDSKCADAYALRADPICATATMNMPWPTPAGRSTSTRDPLPDAKSGDGSTGSGATARAVDDFTAWIETEPRSALAYHLRGGVYTDNYDYDRAIADFTGEIEIKPDNADAYRSRSLAYVKKQNPTTPAGLRRRSGKYNPAIARCGEVFRTKVARRLEMTRRQIQQRESGGRAPP